MGGGLGEAAEDGGGGGDGQELMRTLGRGWGWEDVSDTRGAGAINQAFVSAAS